MSLPVEESEGFQHKTFLEHLEDLRKVLIRSLVAVAAGVVIAIPIAPFVFRMLKPPLAKALAGTGRDPETFLQCVNMLGPFSVSMLVVVLTGFVISAPLIALFAASFVFPGLTSRERKAIAIFGTMGVILFAAGACMGYFLVLPLALKILVEMSQWIGVGLTFASVTEYVMLCLYLMLALGLSFELPVVILILGYLDIVSSRQLRTWRAYVVLIVLVFAAVVTPTVDVFTQLIVAVPMILMYEASIWVLWIKDRRGPVKEGSRSYLE